MSSTRVFVLLMFVTASLACSWIPKIDQQDYCYADYAFEAEVRAAKGLVDDRYYEYEIYIHTVYKGDIKEKLATDNVFGDGPFHSCGPQILEQGVTYLIYAKERDGLVRVTDYKKVTDLNEEDIVRMTTKYDCSCEVNFNFPKIFGNKNAPDLPAASENECNAPEAYCPRTAYCQRDNQGRCTWGDLGECN